MRSGETPGPGTACLRALRRRSTPEKDNVVLLFHALTGSQHAAGFNLDAGGGRAWVEENETGWWEGFVGPGLAVDTDHLAVLCVNYLGGCYGTTGPPSIDEETGRSRMGPTSPPLRLADIVESASFRCSTISG